VRSIQVMIAIRSWSRLVQRRRSRTLRCSSAKNDSIAAFVGGGADPAMEPDHAVTQQRLVELPGSELTASVRMNNASGDVTAAGDRDLQRGNNEPRLHPAIECIADDPVGGHVFDHARIQLASSV
jgi:hypothetical protein